MDMLADVVKKLGETNRQMRKVERDTGVKYFTLLRIRDGKTDPAYSRVKKLWDYYFKPAEADQADHS